MNLKICFYFSLSVLFFLTAFLFLPSIQNKFIIIQDFRFEFLKEPKEICNKIKFSLNNTNISCSFLCIKNLPIGQFGNHVIELLHAYQFAKYIGLSSIIFQHYFMDQIKPFKYKDITIEIATIPYKYYRNHCISIDFYHSLPNLPRIPFEIDQKFKKWYLKRFSKISIPNDTLTIYIRSGSIFDRGYVHRFYGQPPCNYYKDVIKMRNWSDIRIIASDDKNPCVNIIREMGAKFEQHSFDDDFSYLINSKNLVISRGSFSYAVILFSYGIKKLYTFNSPSSRLVDHMNCVPSEKFIQLVLTDWKNSDLQRELIRNSSCMKWEFIPHGNQNLEAFLHERSI
ncbi:hypothetical protein M9Y10_020598 [Tritrichomonas musculus]|uniref:Uncharacterized protein n=1 Tax=Tritrichomonas musculus TaxID=1915356 RepID=A0ABR2HE49_9EUKA